MSFDEILEQIIILLKRQGRVSYRALKMRLDIDDDYLDVLKEELLFAYPVIEEDGRGLVWTGTTEESQTPATPPREKRQSTTPQEASVSQPVSSPSTSQVASPPSDPRVQEAERRQLTVMFCDLVGSTQLSGQLDPEDLREVIRQYQQACSEVIHRFDGHVAQLLGDGLLVYFGYPQAHEDDPQRAVHSGLAIIEAIKTLNTHLEHTKGITLALRLGIHTGLVVVGEMGGAGRHEQLALGETPNIAARLQGLAEPNTLLLSQATAHLIQGYFDCEILGEFELKGVAHPCTVYQVMKASGVYSRLHVASRKGLTPLVGREAEVTLLLERWEQAKSGQGQVVFVTGEAGIGKSRLIQVLKDHIPAETYTRLECYSSSYYINTALYPIIDILQRTLRLQERASAEEKWAHLESFVAQYHVSKEETVPLLAQLLTIPLSTGQYPALNWTPQKQRQKTLETLMAILLELAAHQPLLFVVEDLHWVDPTTLEFLTLLIDQIPTAPIFLFLTTRPDFTSPWGSRSYVTPMTLNRLSPQWIGRLAIQTVGGKTLPEEVIKQIIQKTDGVPLFVEELTKSVVESGVIKEIDGHYELTGPLGAFSIPTSLQDSLMARLDKLSPVKRIAQIGAVIGRQFSYELLQAVAALDEAALQHALRQLVEAELLYQRGLPPQSTYLFKHALIQDTAYQSLLRHDRQQYHSQIARLLTERFPATATEHPELLAQHYTEASLPAIAVRYWRQAGEQAQERSFYREAQQHLTKGLAILATLPDTDEWAEEESLIRLALGVTLSATKGFASLEVAHEYRRAQELCQRLSDFPRLLLVLRGLRQHFLMRGPIQTAYEVGAQYLELAQRLQNATAVKQGHFYAGMPLFCLGELAAARTHLEQGHHQAWWAVLLWHLGFPDQARHNMEQALLKPPFDALNHAIYLMCGSMLSQMCREWVETQHRAATLLTLATERELSSLLAQGIILHGHAQVGLGQYTEGIAQIQEGIDAYLETGTASWHPVYLGMLAAAYGQRGQAEAGLNHIIKALEIVETTEERWWEPELYRLQGELLLQQSQDNQTETENNFQKAIRVAQSQQAKSWELRAATSLARLWKHQDKPHEARALLAPVYTWFTEGFDTLDLQEAKALLDELEEGQ